MSVAFPGPLYPNLSEYALLASTGITAAGTGNVTVTNGYWHSPTGITANLIAAGTPQGNNSTDYNEAKDELTTLKNDIAALPVTNPGYTGGGAQTLTPGVYKSDSTIIFDADADIRFDADNDPDAQFIFIASTSITFGDDCYSTLLNGAQTKNIFWVAQTGAISFSGTGNIAPAGTFIAQTGVTFFQTATLRGPIFANTNITFVGDSEVTIPSVAPAPCYLKGTQILTENGYFPIESLNVGDNIQTFADITDNFEAVPHDVIMRKCIGIQKRVVISPTDINELIFFTAGSLGENTPTHSLYVSPDHAIFADGLLKVAKNFVNWRTIFRCNTHKEIEYYHIELDEHKCVKANGALAESYRRNPRS